MILDAQGRSIGELKAKHEWDKADNEDSEANDKALFSIFNGVCVDPQFCPSTLAFILRVSHPPIVRIRHH